MTTRTIGWAALTGLGVAVCALGCSEDFNDVGDADTADGGSGGGSEQNDGGGGSGGPTNVTTKGSSNGGSSSVGADSSGNVANTNNTTGSVTPARCDDGLINGTETDLDCGGSNCPPCSEGQQCYENADCDDLRCVDGECSSDELPESCADGEQNDTETDVDCGGECAACDVGSVCEARQDCATNRCVQGVCESPRTELENCAASPSAVVEYDTNQELEELLIGAWLRCPNDPSAYPYESEPVDAVGIEFTSDYRYSYLFEDEDGELVRGEGIDFSGEWYTDSENQGATTVAYPGETILVTPYSDPSFGERYYRPTFTEEPTQLREGVWGVFQADRYVPVALPD